MAVVAKRGLPFVAHYTVTGYPPALERSVGGALPHIETIKRLAELYGPDAVVWRYDPIIITSFTPIQWHLDTVASISEALSGSVDEMAASFAHIYRKTRRNTDSAAQAAGFLWEDPEDQQKRDILRKLAEIALKSRIKTTLCSQPSLLEGLEDANVSPARCVDASRLSRVAGRSIAARTKGNRPGCFCAERPGISGPTTCPHGCVYCYAVSDHPGTRERFKAHDPANSRLDTVLGNRRAGVEMDG